VKNLFAGISVVVLAALFCLNAASAAPGVLPAGAQKTQPSNHGVPAPVSESRGVLAVRDASGAPFIVAIARDRASGGSRSSLLVIDATSGKTQQVWYPNSQIANGEVFHLLRAKNGKIYTTIGNTFLEFDVEKRDWTFNAPTDGNAMSFAQNEKGDVFFATYPNSSLFRFDAHKRALEKLGQLDTEEKYPSFLAAGNDGWVYAGIGTARSNLVAFDTQTRRRVQLADESKRKVGNAFVYLSQDGHVYGREFASSESPLLKLENGAATPVPENPFPPKATTGAISWGSVLSEFPDGGKIVDFSLPEKFAVVELNGKTQRITFDYESSGAAISSLIAGPDRKIYGSTNHPMHFFVLDPGGAQGGSTLRDLGPIKEIGGGNFPAFAVSGKFIVGASYSSGSAYEFDTSQPWQIAENGQTINPRLLGKWKEVTRPRAALALPNGDILFGGYGAYGVTGGGLIVYDAKAKTASAILSEKLLPGHSIVALRLLDNKTIIGATSIEAPGGGHVVAREAELFLMNAATHEVAFRTAPVAGARAIYGLEIGDDGKVFGLTDGAQFFVFDPQTRTVIHRADWKNWGAPFSPGNPLWRGADGNVYAALGNNLLQIQPDYGAQKIADLPAPITAGGVLLNGRFYFASGAQLWSIAVGDE
jgi:hypothetical protein